MGVDFNFKVGLSIGDKKYKPKEVAEMLNVSVKTLQRWDREGILVAQRTPTDRRYYTEEQLTEFKQPKASDNVSDIIQSIKNRYEILEGSNRLNSQNIEVHVFVDIFLAQMGYDFDYRDCYFVNYTSRDYSHIDLTVVNNENKYNYNNILFVTFKGNASNSFIQETKDFITKMNCNHGMIIDKRKWIILQDDKEYEIDFSKDVDKDLFSGLHFNMVNK